MAFIRRSVQGKEKKIVLSFYFYFALILFDDVSTGWDMLSWMAISLHHMCLSQDSRVRWVLAGRELNTSTKKRKKMIYLTPCCLHTFSPLVLWSQCSSSDVVCYKQLCEMQAPIYHFWSSALVFLKTHIKYFSDQMMKHGEKKKKIQFSLNALCWGSPRSTLRSSKSPSFPTLHVVTDLGIYSPTSQARSSFLDTLSLSRLQVCSLRLPLSHHKPINMTSLCRIDCNLLTSR